MRHCGPRSQTAPFPLPNFRSQDYIKRTSNTVCNDGGKGVVSTVQVERLPHLGVVSFPSVSALYRSHPRKALFTQTAGPPDPLFAILKMYIPLSLSGRHTDFINLATLMCI